MSTAELLGDERLPLYQRLADSLRQEIVDGVRGPGDQLPSENVIAVEYGLAPGTARQALAKLVGEGILERFHGKGTFVRHPSFDKSLFRFFRFRGAEGAHVVPQSRILQRTIEPAPGHVAQHLQIEADEPSIFINRLRLIDGVPVVVEEIWLPLEAFRNILTIESDAIGPLLYPLYSTLCGHVVARAHEDLTVGRAEVKTAEILCVSRGEPVIVIDRLARGYDDTPLEWRRSRGRADQFHYHTEIR